MIWIFQREIADAGSCENYDDLFQYINLKILEDDSEFEQTPWSFTFFTPHQVSVIYDNAQQSLLTEIAKEAYEKEMGFIEICQGDFENSLEILGTPDIDMESLKKQWCLAYCNAHDYIVVENFPHHSSDQSQWYPGMVRASKYPKPAQELHNA